MATFMDVHNGFVGVTARQLREAHERDLAIEQDEGVHFERAWLDPETGKVFCLSTGPTREAVMRIHERAGHPTAEVYELSRPVPNAARTEDRRRAIQHRRAGGAGRAPFDAAVTRTGHLTEGAVRVGEGSATQGPGRPPPCSDDRPPGQREPTEATSSRARALASLLS